MIRILLVLAISFAAAWALTLDSIDWPLRPGLMGAVLLVAAALGARAWWERRRATVGDEPGGPERDAWHALVGYAAISGHMLGALSKRVDLHLGAGNSLAADTWTIIAGSIVAYLIVRSTDRTRDERDKAFHARGDIAGYTTLGVLIFAFALYLAFVPPPGLDGFTHFYIANFLIALIVLSEVIKQLARLLAYARDRKEAAG